nr:RNA-directed DNA polymerase, eukaryota, reverse transcriptase zinc-binding domain protein [Tanacetum cinerariifolium]
MSKLDHFLITKGIISLFPSLTALCLDRHLSDHRLILLRELPTDFGPTPFYFYHSWFRLDGLDDMVEQAWLSLSHTDSNGLIIFKKKLQDLKIIIRRWVKDKKLQQSGVRSSIIRELSAIDKDLDRENVFDVVLLKRMELMRQLQDINQMKAKDSLQKSKIKWAIEGDENSKFFQVFVDGNWSTEPGVVKDAFKYHFAARFKRPVLGRLKLNISFTNRLSSEQVVDMDRSVSRDEIRMADWNC